MLKSRLFWQLDRPVCAWMLKRRRWKRVLMATGEARSRTIRLISILATHTETNRRQGDGIDRFTPCSGPTSPRDRCSPVAIISICQRIVIYASPVSLLWPSVRWRHSVSTWRQFILQTTSAAPLRLRRLERVALSLAPTAIDPLQLPPANSEVPNRARHPIAAAYIAEREPASASGAR